MNSVRYPVWLQAGVCAIALLCLISGLQAYRAGDAYGRAYQDPYMIGAQPARLGEAVRLLPANTVVGYLSDLSFTDTPGQAAYFGVAYALAPRLLTRSADDPQWVIGNFSHPMDFAAAGAAHHLAIVRDFGNGVVIFQRRP